MWNFDKETSLYSGKGDSKPSPLPEVVLASDNSILISKLFSVSVLFTIVSYLIVIVNKALFGMSWKISSPSNLISRVEIFDAIKRYLKKKW